MLDTIKSPIQNPMAFSYFEQLGLPTLKNDSWKYTSTNQFIPAQQCAKENIATTGDIVIENGELIKGEQFLTSKKLEKDHFQNEPLFHLTTAYSKKQSIFEVSESLTIDIINNGHVANSFVENTFIITGDKKITLKINLLASAHTLSLVNNHFVSTQNSNAQVISMQNAHHDASLIINHSADIERDASLEHFNLNSGAKTARHNISFRINGTGAHGAAHGLYALKNTQHCDTSSLIEHNAPHTTSAQLYKTILDERARGIFTGLIRVLSHAMPIESNQLNKNLLLSNKAHANSRPQLEVFADDVKASHGSTTGQLSDQELFYLISRGIKPDKARSLLAKAFAEDVLLKIEDDVIRKDMQEHFRSITEGI
jgi:Fe-S cluster assembly protein SufD